MGYCTHLYAHVAETIEDVLINDVSFNFNRGITLSYDVFTLQ